MIGAWMRMFAFSVDGGLFYMLFLGMLLFDLSSPMIFNGLSLVTTAWYAETE